MTLSHEEQYQRSWQERQEIAENMQPIIGRLYRNKAVELVVYGKPLVNATTIDIIKSHKTVERFEQQKSKNPSFQKNKSTLPEKNTPEEITPRNWDISFLKKQSNQNKLIAEHNDLVKKYNELKAQLKQLSSNKPKTENPFESPDISYPEEEDSSILSSYQFWRGLSIVLLLTCGYAGYREYERYHVVATTPTVAVTSAPPAPTTGPLASRRGGRATTPAAAPPETA